MLRNSLIVLPLKSEFKFLTESFKKLGLKSSESLIGPIPIKKYDDLNLICAVGGHGKVQFGIQTQFLLHQFPEAKMVFCVGAAGGLAKVKTFDVVVAEHTVEHDFTERIDPAPPPSFPGCLQTINQMKRCAKVAHLPFAVHHGIIASGDEDVTSRERAFEIHSKNAAIAVAWEGAGGARASAFNSKPYIEVRGITDVADSGAPIDFHANLKKSMENVAILFATLMNLQ